MVTMQFDQAEKRDPPHGRRWIVLVDGANHQLECLENKPPERGVDIDIIADFAHVLECLWKATGDLQHPTQPARAAFVQATARDKFAPLPVGDHRCFPVAVSTAHRSP
ncbi:hypothetical protein [Streptomyces sp. 2A115]|uniref:hypothetical protein n=1 Tax=Streptomyces sp. 2A115 TaxID=3457439 RepID=UPI003FD430A8